MSARFRFGAALEREPSLPLAVDTEYYDPAGEDLRSYSPASRAKIHCWSVCWGVGDGDYAVLWPEHIEEWRDVLENRDVLKVCHNASVEYHAFRAHGVTLAGVIDTLALARWLYPGRDQRMGGGGWSLDAMARDFLGDGKTESFQDLTTELVEVWSERQVEEAQCRCGAWGCGDRGQDGHRGKFLDRRTTTQLTSRVEERSIPLQAIVEGHPRYERLLEYSAKDARITWPLFNIMRGEQNAR